MRLMRGASHVNANVFYCFYCANVNFVCWFVSTASMKAMSPLPMILQMDHSSSTESAHDQTENNKSKDSGGSKRRPSKIPLKSYTAPKPPGGMY